MDVVVERSVALRYRLQLVVEVDDDLAQRQVEQYLDAPAGDVGLLDQHAALVETQLHDGADELRLRDYGGADVGLLNVLYERRVVHTAGVVYLRLLAVLVENLIADVGHRRDDLHVELAVQALLHYLHVEQAEEAAAEAEAQGQRRLGRERQRRVVELQFLQRRAQVLEVLRHDGIDAGEDHRLHLLEALDGGLAGALLVRDGVAHLHLRRRLDARADVAHVAAAHLLPRLEVHAQDAHLVGVVGAARVDELYLVALAQRAVHYLIVGYDAAVAVEHRVEDQRLQRCLGVALRRRDAVDDGVQNLRHAHARLAAGAQYLLALAAQQLDYLVLHHLGHGRVEVALIDDRYDGQVVLDGHVEIRYRLRLDALRAVHDEQCALARRYRAAHLVGEVHVAGRVDEVQHVPLPAAHVVHLYGVALDGDAALALQVHIVEHLRLHLPLPHRLGVLQQTVGQRRLAVVDVRYDAEVSDILHLRNKVFSAKILTFFILTTVAGRFLTS